MTAKLNKENIEDIYPMSDIQLGMVYHSLKESSAATYHNQMVFQRKERSFNPGIFKKAVMLMAEKHPMLRTGFSMGTSKEPLQVVFKNITPDLRHVNISHLDKVEQEKYVMSFLARDRRKPFNLTVPEPLWRMRTFAVGSDNICYIWICHHAITDGWSTASFLTELNNTYRHLKVDPDFVPVKLKNSYKTFVLEQILEKKNIKNIEYWQNELANYKRFDFLSTIKSAPGADHLKRYHQDIHPQLHQALDNTAREYKTSIRNISFAAYVYMLNMLSYDSDTVVGLVSHNRPVCKDANKIMGCFLNTVPIRIKIPGKTLKWCDYIRLVDEKLLELESYNRLSLLEIVKIIGEKTQDQNPIFDTIFNFTDFHIYKQFIHADNGKIGQGMLSLQGNEITNTQFNFNINLTSGSFSIFIDYVYPTVTDQCVETLYQYFEAVLNRFVMEPEGLARKDQLLSPKEKEEILYDFNKTEAQYPRDKTIHELFTRQVHRTPTKTAVISGNTKLTYRELNQKSNQLAAILKAKGIQPDTAVGIMIERSQWMIVGIMAILKAGAAYLPIDSQYPAERKKYMLLDSNANLLLTQDQYMGKTEWAGEIIDPGNEEIYKENKPHLPVVNRPTDLAYIIYTSGTTGKPKGTTIKHTSLVNRLNWMQKRYPINCNDTILQKTPFTFDVSVWEMFCWSLQGAAVCFLAPGGEKDPEVIVNTIEKHHITVMHFVPSMLNAFLEYAAATNVVKRLPTLKQVFASGEALTVNQVKTFNQLLREKNGTKLVNLYGPTEATIEVTYFDCPTGEDINKIPIGKPIDNIRLFVLGKYKEIQPPGAPGELYITGIGLARGYLNLPELTMEKFIHIPVVSCQRMYRTGDLAKWLPDGNIEFLGRIDRQLKVRGFRIELEEIENRLWHYDGIKEAIVLGEDGKNGETYICAYIVPNLTVSAGTLDLPHLKEYLTRVLPGYMIPSHFVQIEKIPLTPNGKVDIKALPAPAIQLEHTPAAPRNQLEEKLVEIWSEVLAIEKDKIGINANFFDQGAHSLDAIMMVSKIHKKLKIKLLVTDIFKRSTVKSLAEYMKGKSKNTFAPIKLTEKREYYAFTSAQKRMFFVEMLRQDTGYNMPSIMKFAGEMDIKKIEEIFKKLIRRHEAFRSTFEVIGGQLMQRVHEKASFQIDYCEAREEEALTIVRRFIRRFDLSKAPLLRVKLIKIREKEYIFMLDIHHIIMDALSQMVLLKEFTRLYQNEILPAVKIQYKDYSQWQEGNEQKEAIKKQEEYWLNLYSGEIPILNLPLDYPRPDIQDYQTETLYLEISREELKSLRSMVIKEKATLFMVLLAVYNIFLSKISGQPDILVGTPLVNRRHDDLSHTIGMFVNTLVLRNYPRGEMSFNTFFRELRANTLEAFENQQYEFDDLVDALKLERQVSRNPLIDAMFIFETPDNTTKNISGFQIPGIKISPFDIPGPKGGKFDLSFECFDAGSQLSLKSRYCTRLFKAETMKRFKGCLLKILSSVIENPGIKISEIEIISAEDREQLLFEFNNTKTEYPNHKTIHQLFAEQVERTPDYVALVGNEKVWKGGRGEGEKNYKLQNTNYKQNSLRAKRQELIAITYKELNEKSNHLAHLLQTKHAKPDTIVGIMMERSVEMIIGVLGILKAGGAYLPVDPGYPEERINYMLTDSSAKVLVTTSSLIEEGKKVRRFEGKKILLEEVFETPSSSSTFPSTHQHLPSAPAIAFSSLTSTLTSTCQVGSTNLAYIIYTSGSTGKPKGVIVEHRSVVNRLNWMQRSYPIREDDVILQKTPFTFDVSVWELFWWSFQGASVCLLGHGDEKSPAAIIEAIERDKVTTIHFVPSMLNAFLEYLGNLENLNGLSTLRHVFASGEALSVHHVEMFNQLLNKRNDTKLINLYGPTEATVDVSYFNCPEREKIEKIPIGKPIDNIRLYVVNKSMSLQPIGIPGELCIAGLGLARGYLNNPELTVEKFDHDLGDFQDYPDKKKKIHMQSFNHAAMQPYIHTIMQYHSPSQYPITPLSHYPIYMTGDLARWLPDGNIEFLGRIDHQVKIRGFRVELAEIECHLLNYNEIKEAVVATKEDKNEDICLCAYIVSNKELTVSHLRSYLSKNLPDYMLPTYFIPLDKIPLTASGKVDGKHLPEPGTMTFSRDQAYIAPRTIIEKTIAGIWENVLAINSISINDNFFEIGGDSIKIIPIISRLKTAGYKVEMGDIFRNPRILELAPLAKEIGPGEDPKISNPSTREKKELTPSDLTYPDISIETLEQLQKTYSYLVEDIYPLTPLQEAMLFYTLYEDKNRPLYFQQMSYQWQGELNVSFFKRTIQELFKRHDIFRTVFIYEGLNRPLQVVLKERNVEFYFEDLRESLPTPGEKERFIREFREKDRQRSFDLSKDVLLRLAVFQSGDTEYQVCWSSYHILMDGWCMGILISEFSEIFAGFMENRTFQLPGVKPYKTYIQWLEKQEKEKTKSYWKKYLEGYQEIAAVPRKESRGTFAGGYKAAAASTRFEEEKTIALDKVAIRNRVTLNTVIQVVWGIVLGKYSSKQDVVFGMLVSGRPSEVEGVDFMVGCFINTIPVRITFDQSMKFNELLRIAQDKAIENEPYHYLSLAEIQMESTVRQNLLDHIIQFQNFPIAERVERVGDDISGEEKTGRVDGAADDIKRNDNVETVELADVNVFEQGGDYNFYITIVPQDQIDLSFSYNANLYDNDLVEQLGFNCIRVLEQIIENDNISIGEIVILSEEERRKILFQFNNNRVDFPRDKTIHQFVEKHAEMTPDHVALIGQIPNPKSQIPNKEAPFGQVLNAFGRGYLTYRELNERANRLALVLSSCGIQKDEPVGILMERSQFMAESILGVWKAGGAYMPIDPGYPDDRIDHMLSNSKTKVLLTTSGLSEKYEKLSTINCQLLMVNEIPPHSRRLNNPPKGANSINNYQLTINNLQLDPTNLAYIIYTSGSTGKPKGVMIEHIGMMNHIQAKINDLQLTQESIVAQNATHTFDISIWQFFAALTVGGQTVIYPDELIMEPGKFLSRLVKDQITILEVVPSYLSVLLDDNPEPRTLPLSLQYLLVTGEEIKPHLVKKWFDMYPNIKMVNAYGPTEASDDITHYLMDKAPDMARIPIGKPLQNLNIYIVDNRMQLCAVGVKGEICVSGVGVGRGYIGDEQKTKQCFIENPFVSPITNESSSSFTNDQCPMTNDRSYKLYLTGDLGAWLPNGTIVFFGRKDYQVKIRGFRIELGEIENQLVSHKEIKDAVVIDREDKAGNQYLCAYIVAQRMAHGAWREELREFLSKTLPNYMVPAHFLQLDKIPITSSGKLDRKALPEPEGDEIISKYVAPGNHVEKKLVEIWAKVLGKEEVVIGIHHNFFDLGGHSLNAIVLAAKVHKEFDVKVPLAELFKTPTISELSRYIKKSIKDKYASIGQVEKRDYYALSSAQKRLYILQQMDLKSSAYNIPQVITLPGEPHIKKLEKMFIKLINRHESLRTSFQMVNHEPVQKIYDTVEFKIEYYEKMVSGQWSLVIGQEDHPHLTHSPHSTYSTRDIIRHFSSAFDLSQAPLLRVGIVEADEEKYILAVVMHHIISDGVSNMILGNDFRALYQGKELPTLRIQYKDFSVWQNIEKQKEYIKEQERYWLQQFEAKIPELDLPTDYIRPKVQLFEGSFYNDEISCNTDTIRTIASENGATTFMVLLAIFNIFLSKVCGQEDIVMGTPVVGRRHADLARIMGLFVNSLALRNRPKREKTFLEFLKEVRDRTLEAFDNQDYQFEDLVEKLAIERARHNPIFDVMFTCQDQETDGTEDTDVTDIRTKDQPKKDTRDIRENQSSNENEPGTSKFDLTLHIVIGKKLLFSFNYSTELFKKQTIEILTTGFKEVVLAVLENRNIKLKDIGIAAALPNTEVEDIHELTEMEF